MLDLVSASSAGPTLEDIIDELARVFHDPDVARELALRAGFPRADLPAFRVSMVFWSQVVHAAADGKLRGGAAPIVERARAMYPGNPVFAGGGSAGAGTAEPTTRAGGTNGSRASASPVDVVIITAAEGEDTALREVSEGARSGWAEVPPPAGYSGEIYRAAFDSLVHPGQAIHVVTTRPPRMGSDHTGFTAGQLSGVFTPRCLAICGVCAGRPEWTELGDVVIADRVWRYDTGEQRNAVPGGRPTFKKDTELFALSPTWLRAAENAKPWARWPGRDRAWLDARPRSLELQGLWLMKVLADGQQDPADHADVDRMCADWKDVVAQLKKDGHVVAGKLTDAGREHLEGVLFENKKRLPEPPPWALHVAPMGTGNHLVSDVDIWASLEDAQRLVCAFDMEASTIGVAGWSAQIPFLAVKGVMDFGLPDRHRGFRSFAARAAAEVLVRLLRTLVTPAA